MVAASTEGACAVVGPSEVIEWFRVEGSALSVQRTGGRCTNAPIDQCTKGSSQRGARPAANAPMGPRGRSRSRCRWQCSGIQSPLTSRHSQRTQGGRSRGRTSARGYGGQGRGKAAGWIHQSTNGTMDQRACSVSSNLELGTRNLEPVQWNAPCDAFSFAATEQPPP